MKNIYQIGLGRETDSNGDPLNGGKIFFYEPGTTTKKDTYPTKDDADAQTNANANPVVLDAGGLPTHGIFLRGDYKCVITTSDDTDPPASPLRTLDNINKTEDLLDNNGNETLELGETASAVNHVKITNAATGNDPVIEFTGSDTNVGGVIKGKGTGALDIGVVSGTGDINILTGDKSITLDETNDDITLDSGPSTIIMNGATGAIAVDSNAGDTTLSPSGAGNVIVSPSSGNVTMNPTSGDVTINPGGSLTLQANVFPTADGTSGQYLKTDGSGNLAYKTLNRTKNISVPNPGASEDITIFYTPTAITVDEMVAVLVGSSTPSVTWTIRHSTDRSAAGNEIVTSGTTTTSTTTGSVVSSFNDATIPADSFVWLETTAQSGTVDLLSVSISYKED